MPLTLEFLTPDTCEKPYSISQINTIVANILEQGNTLVWVEGELSTVRKASSGHCYFRLKDAESQIPAVLWRSNALRVDFDMTEGLAVSAIASVRVYQKGGYYQLDVHRLQPAGAGAMWLALEKLKAKLTAEGIFDEDRKKPLPTAITRLGVITSKNGAAFQDIIKVVKSRDPGIDIVLYDVLVQGEKAPPQIADAIEAFNTHDKVDCLIVGRGGGSAEDLWAFNDERVIRAIAASDIPVVTAIGHEIDFTLSDFAADMRAPTPSAAAEIVVPDKKELSRYTTEISRRFITLSRQHIASAFERFDALSQRPVLRKPIRLISEMRQHVDEMQGDLSQAALSVFGKYKELTIQAGQRLNALSPLSVLSRGYSVVSKADGKSIKDASMLVVSEEVTIRFSKGQAGAVIRHCI